MTRDDSWLPGAATAGGWRDLGRGPADEPVGGAASGDRLLALAHLSDLHLCDAASPARQEYLDHLGDPGSPWAGRMPEIGTYRPQEVLTLAVAVAALRAVGRVDGLDGVLVTGDATDNAQTNELGWYAALMSGGTLRAATAGWVGAVSPDPWFWHPDRGADDLPTTRYGYPAVPGLTEAAAAPVVSPGVGGLAWFGTHGNHDRLLQGVVPPDAALDALAVGDRRITDLPPARTPWVVLEAVPEVGPARYPHDASSPWVPVRPDAGRTLLGDGDFRAAQVAAGHAGRPGPGNAWTADVGDVLLVGLDTVNPHGGWQGSLDEDQLAWLDEELDRAGDRYVVVCSHHPSWTLSNGWAPPGASRRVLADEVVATLLRHRGVVAWLAGHVHAHTSLWHPRPAGLGPAGGLWEITTASLIDWPQQGRVVELVREPDGLALVSTTLDHLGGPASDRLEDPLVLAGWSRLLAANDYRGRDGMLARAAGRPADRDATWRLPDPHR